ncbi:hypothetical protein IKE98_03110 [Candidatus Saccharibacteria bacterium]|nr:hypothetical protein [Candidatus Saccharibacteria bacterium]
MKNFFLSRMLTPNQEFLNETLEETDNLFLCGLPLSVFLDPKTNAFGRFFNYLRVGLNSEATTMAMIALKDIPSTRFVQGIVDDAPHSWVEFTLKDEEYVADLAWYIPFIVKKEEYYDSIHFAVPMWVCTYNDFWDLPLIQSIYSCMLEKETSEGVFVYLSEFKSYDVYSSYGFSKKVLDEVVDPEFFCPYEINGKLISSSIIRDLMMKGKVAPQTIEAARALLYDVESVVTT